MEHLLMVSTAVSAPIETVWYFWTHPHHMKRWFKTPNEWYITQEEHEQSTLEHLTTQEK